MSVADKVRPLLIADSTVFNLIGFTWGTAKTKEIRSTRGDFQSGTKIPCLTYEDVSGVPGVLDAKDYCFQITAWGSNDVECQTVAYAVQKALESYSGTLDGVNVEKIVCYYWTDSSHEVTTNLWYSIRKFEALHW